MNSNLSNERSAIIIGSGVAGIAAAIRLAVAGFKVDVYERNAYPGGKLSMFTAGGFQFDEGPSLFTEPSLVEELFTLANENIDDYFSYHPVEISCKYFFENGIVVNGYCSAEKFAAELHDKCGEPEKNVLTYLGRARHLYKNIGSVFLNYSLHLKTTWLHSRTFAALKAIKWPYLFQSLDHYNNNQFKTAEAKQIFNRYATYNGSDPFQAPAMLSLIPHLEVNDGTFYARGGMISITNALVKLALCKGVVFHFNKDVQKIILEQNVCKGIAVDGENYFADVVISNADVYFTYLKLLGLESEAKKVLKQERSSSALIFYWGVSTTFSRLQLHNIFFSENYREEFNAIFKTRTVFEDPTVYINITSKEETGQAPVGKENWFVMVNVPANTGQDWAELTKQVKQSVIRKLNRILQTDIEALIEFESVMDPVAIERKTGSYMGSLYGTSSNNKMAAFFRHPNYTQGIKNLYHCGGSVHPGGGIPLCLKSAAITTEIIKNDFKIKSGHIE